MGLDNIPKEYPCAAKATRDSDNRIDCAKTQEENNCTWKNERESNPIVKNINPAGSMFGTDCWYRGKYGNYLLGILSQSDNLDDSLYTFYGDGDDGISARDCLDMSKWMKDNTEQFAYNLQKEENKQLDTLDSDYINDWIYASWWLEFVGKNCDGSKVWW